MNIGGHGRAAIAMALAAVLGACGDSELEVSDFGKTSDGDVVLAAADFCSLRVAGSDGDMLLMLSRQGTKDPRIAFEGKGIARPAEASNSDFALLVRGQDGQVADFAGDEAQYIKNGINPPMVSLPATPALIDAVRSAQSVSFTWNGVIANMIAKPKGLAEGYALMDKCLGTPIARLYPVESR